MIPLQCLKTKSNNRTPGQFEYDVTLFFLFLRFLIQCLFTFSGYENKTGWLQNEH